VSEEVAREMARGVCKRFDADLGVAITGIAGPKGGTREKPVGLVYVAIAGRAIEARAWRLHVNGDRAAIQARATVAALGLLWNRLSDRD